MARSGPLLLGGTLVLTDRITTGTVVVRGDTIEDVLIGHRGLGHSMDWPGYILPGLVDIHVHGAGGRSFNEDSAASWESILALHRANGTTAAVATLAAATWPDLSDAMSVGYALAGDEAPVLAGMHLEGPYLSPAHRGAHGPAVLTTPADEMWRSLLEGDDARTVKMITLAPELAGAEAAMMALSAMGVVVSVGHTAIAANGLDRARRHGVRHAAHLWSAQTGLTKQGPVRRPGLLEGVLSSDEMTAEIIADGHHVTAEMARIAYRCLGPDRLCVVSDASAGTGMPAGYQFRIGAAEGIVDDGVAVSRDGTSFCGSTTFLFDMLRFCVDQAGIPLLDAVRMCTTTPARVARIDATGLGAIVAGGPANLILTDPALRLCSVFSGGRWIERSEPGGTVCCDA